MRSRLPWGSVLGPVATLILMRATAPAGADVTTPTPLHVIDTLTVRALRTPATLGSVPYSVNSISVGHITAHETGMSLSEALADVPGVQVDERHNLSQGDRISIRGVGARASFGVRGLRILVDGIPLTMADGQSQLGIVDLSQIERIDVIRGPAAALYGNAAGGVLHLHSRPVTDDVVHVGALTGSDGLQQIRFRADIVRGDDRLFFGGSHTDSDGFREHAYSRQRTFQAGWQRPLSQRVQLAVVGHFYDAPWLYNPSSLDRASADEYPQGVRLFVRRQGAAKQVRHTQLGTRLTWTRSPDSGLELGAHVVGRSLANPIPGRIIDLRRLAFGLRVVGHHRWRPAWESIAGIEFEAQDDRREEFANEGLDEADVDRFRDDTIFDRIQIGERRIDQEESASAVGLFVLNRWQPDAAWTMSLGTRVDRHGFDVEDALQGDEHGGDDSGERRLIQWSPTVGVTWTPSTRLTLYANSSTAYLTPTTVELGNRADGSGGFNPDLEPERYLGVEAGTRYLWPRYQLEGSAAIYQLHLKDMLVPFGIADSEEVFYRNASAARHRGLDLQLRWLPRHAVQLDGSFSLADFVYTHHSVRRGQERIDVDGNRVPAVAPWTASVSSRWRPTPHTMLVVSGHHQARTDANDLNGPAPGVDAAAADFREGAWTRIDLRASAQRIVESWDIDLFVGIDNVFDATYSGSLVPNAFGDRFFEPAPGRKVFAGLRLRRPPGSLD